MQKAIFSIPLNPKLSPEAFSRFYSIVEKYKDYIYDIYFTSRMPPFIQDAMGDVFDKNQADHIIENAFILQNNLGIPLSATFNNIEVPPTKELLDLWIEIFSPLYERGYGPPVYIIPKKIDNKPINTIAHPPIYAK